MKRLLGWLGERLIVSLSVFASVGIVAALATNYTMTQGSGTTFGSIVVTAVNYPQMLLCDLTTPSQCASVSAGGAVKVDNSAVTQPSNVSQINSVTPLMGNGVTGTGSQRVTIASDNTAFTVNPSSATTPVVTMNSASANSGVNSALAGVFDDVAPTAITENSFGFLRMSTNRNLYGTIRDAAGNERGVNVDASNRLTTAPTIVSGAVASGAYASGAFASGSIGSGAVASGAVASGAFASGALASGSVATGAIVDLTTNGATTAHTCSVAGNSVLGCLGQIDDDVKGAIATGTNNIGNVGSATGSAPPSIAVYLGANASGATGGKLAGVIQCDNHVFKHITTATDTLAVQGVASQTIYVCGWRSRAAGVATWFLENTASANANCSSSNTQITGVATEAANTGEVLQPGFWNGLKNTSGNGLCINSTGTGGVDVDVWYTQF